MHREILRLATAGSVDDGKSTLIGRLLYDSKSLFEDQIEAIEIASAQRGANYLNLALVTDGLRAEREQGITIDVAYRYFATPRRSFIIADAPGHIQYTRNMVTGASTADLAIILLDITKGITEQSRRHAFLTSMLRVPHLVVAVNKMDLVGYDQAAYERIAADFRALSARLNSTDITLIPISALHGDNVVERSFNMPWYNGPPLLHHLENVHIASDRNLIDVRFPVQSVTRVSGCAASGWRDYRGYAGQVAGGVLKQGDEVIHLPSGLTSTIVAIDGPSGRLDEAFPPMSVTVRLADEIDVCRGDMLARPGNRPRAIQDLEALVCWMAPDRALRPDMSLRVKHTTRTTRALVKSLRYRVDINTFHRDEAAAELGLNEIGRISLRLSQPVFADEYARNKATGGFVLIDEATNGTVGVGLVLGSGHDPTHADDSETRL
jgi:bifunctional enzyme CysN/CysC